MSVGDPSTVIMRKEQVKLCSLNDGHRGVQANSFYYRSIKAWNDFPREVVDAKSFKTFIERLEANWEHKKVIKIDP